MFYTPNKFFYFPMVLYGFQQNILDRHATVIKMCITYDVRSIASTRNVMTIRDEKKRNVWMMKRRDERKIK